MKCVMDLMSVKGNCKIGIMILQRWTHSGLSLVLVILICNNFIILLKKNEVARVVVFKVNEGFK